MVKQTKIRMLLERILRERGFKKVGSSLWMIDRGELVHLVRIDRSRFAPDYFLDLGILAKGVPSFEIENIPVSWHVDYRIPDLLPDARTVPPYFSEDADISDDEREAALRRIVGDSLKLIFEDQVDENSLREMLQARRPRFLAIRPVLLEYLGLPKEGRLKEIPG